VKHLLEEILSAYSLDPDAVENRDEIDSHLAECDVCRDGLEVYRALDLTLRHPDTRDAAERISLRNPRLEEILAAQRKVVDEERAAHAVLASLLKSPLKFRNAKLAEKPRCHTQGMVRVLCAEANARHEQRPKFSRLLAESAYAIATKLPDDAIVPKRTAMGLALRERANALRYLGSFADALKLLDYAEKLFDRMPAADVFDIAIVRYIRATVFMKSDRLTEGIIAARAAATVFRDYGDRTREIAASVVEACCLLLSRKTKEAAESFERVILLSRSGGDTGMLVRGLHNAGRALLDLRELDRAERYLVEALALYDELDVPTEKARATWTIASIVIARGDLHEGERRLNAIRTELARFGLTNDAALATLEWAEVRLALGRTAGVADACRAIVVVFETEGMRRHAKHALAVLNSALAAGRATPELVRHVRSYLEQLPANPAQAFVPLQ